MRSNESVSLPVPGAEYDQIAEQIARRTVEHALDDLRRDIVDSRDFTDKPASLSHRRMQFLLMGS
jgi:hypothetical protein